MRLGHLLFFILFIFSGISSTANGSETINLLILGTPSAIDKLGGWIAFGQKIKADVANINQSFINSGIEGRVKLVGSNVFNEEIQGCMYDALNHVLTLDDDELKKLNIRRNAYAADVVIIIVNEPSFCGISGAYADPAQSFALVHYACLGENYSMARQLGYLLGCGNNQSQDGRFNPDNDSAYAYYFENEEAPSGKSFATIMGYTDEQLSFGEDDFNMIPYWSSSDPNIKYENRPVGDNFHDNAGQINKAFHMVTSYRYYYGLLEFDDEELPPGCLGEIEVDQSLSLKRFRQRDESTSSVSSKRIRLTEVIAERGCKAHWKATK